MSETTPDQIEALTRSVISTDNARRVGFARAFAAEASKEQLSRDLNVMRMQRDTMRRTLSFAVGFIRGYAPQQSSDALGRHVRQMEAVLDQRIVGLGRKAGQESLTPDQELKREELKVKKKAEKRRSAQHHGREFRAAREQERKLIMKRYGFPSEAALWNYLSLYGGEEAE